MVLSVWPGIGLSSTAADIEIREYWSSWWIVVQDIMMDQLLMPDAFGCFDIETDERR
jgi:hypothetical protein